MRCDLKESVCLSYRLRWDSTPYIKGSPNWWGWLFCKLTLLEMNKDKKGVLEGYNSMEEELGEMYSVESGLGW